MTDLATLSKLPAGKWRMFTHDPGNARYCFRGRKVTLYFVDTTADGGIIGVVEGSV